MSSQSVLTCLNHLISCFEDIERNVGLSGGEQATLDDLQILLAGFMKGSISERGVRHALDILREELRRFDQASG